MSSKHWAERDNFYEASYECMKATHPTDTTFPWIKPEKWENLINGHHHVPYPFNSAYSHTQPVLCPVAPRLLSCSWTKRTEAIGCNERRAVFPVGMLCILWQCAWGPAREFCLSLSVRHHFSWTTRPLLSCGPWTSPRCPCPWWKTHRDVWLVICFTASHLALHTFFTVVFHDLSLLVYF